MGGVGSLIWFVLVWFDLVWFIFHSSALIPSTPSYACAETLRCDPPALPHHLDAECPRCVALPVCGAPRALVAPML